IERAHRSFATRTRALDAHLQVLYAILRSAFTGALGGHLSRKRRTLARPAKPTAARRTPGQHIALTIGNRNDGIIKRRVYECDAVTYIATSACFAGTRV